MTPRNEPFQTAAPAVINIMDVLRGVAHRKALILGTGLFAFAIGMGVVTLLKPVYTSKAQVLIQNLETPFDRMQQTENPRAEAIDDRVVASQISVIRSEDLGRRVIAALGLENKPEFNSLIEGQGTVGKLKVKLGFGSDPALKTPEERALDRYNDKLNVYQLPDSNVIGIEYNSSNPETAASVANTLADTYVMWTREAQSQPTERARDWLSQQIDAIRKRLAQSEEAVERFRAEAGLLKGATVTLGEQEISELNSQISVAKAASLEARARADSIRQLLETRGGVESATDVLNSAAVQRLKEQRTEASRRMAELSVTYLSNHPKMIAVRNEISNIDKQIRAEALKVVSSLDEQARIAETREKSLIASLENLKNQESNANLDDVKLKALERDAGADRVLLEAMLSRYAEASARQDLSAQPGLGVVIQNASVPTSPSFPKTGPMVLLITFAGFALGISLAFLLELMAAAGRVPETANEPEDRPEPAVVPPAVHPVPSSIAATEPAPAENAVAPAAPPPAVSEPVFVEPD
uniref:GumC family protein n=1 Tax=Aestuariivirga sp. TaxID=2650926 RepID=UPI003593EF28